MTVARNVLLARAQRITDAGIVAFDADGVVIASVKACIVIDSPNAVDSRLETGGSQLGLVPLRPSGSESNL